MAEDVTRLKELLFDREARAITDLSARMDAVFERSGSQERFTASVASVLDEALARAEVERHSQVAGAIAPLVVSTIRSEIRNSQDELAEALYPAMGRMVKDYVVSAFRDLADEINRRFEHNRFMLRVRSLLTGRPVAELAMAYAPPPKVEEIYLVRRGSGELVGRWPAAGNPRDHTRSGVLAAINEIATDAFIAEEASLRRLDLGSSLVYMRASPAHLLFVRCAGAAPRALEQTIDSHFMATIEKLRPLIGGQSADASTKTAAVNGLLTQLATGLDGDFAARRPSRRGGLSPAALLFWALILLLLCWGGWRAYSAFQTARVRNIAERVIADDGALRGFPVHVGVDDNGASVALLGLVPKPADALDVTRRLREALPASRVIDRTAALPGGLAEARAQIGALSAQVTELAAAGTRSAQATNDALAALTAELKRSREDASRLETQITQSNARSKAQIAALQAEVVRLSQPSAAQRLAEWVRTNAIFYDKETDFRDARTAAASLDELAALLKETQAFVRVVGHTDEKGGQTHNSPLSLARATMVAAELRRRGVPAAQLIAVGRNDVANLSPTIGDASPNRRVEFEIGFKHETPQ
jgi:outer membrane protein OmpA-like peptidoglycan-associated protein